MANKIEDTMVKGLSLSDTLEKGDTYQIDYYQRGYAWGAKEVTELLNDLLFKFGECYSEGDDTKATVEYKQYFLGSYVLSRKGASNYVIDGQQRLTTLTLVYMAMQHVFEDAGDTKKAQRASSFVYGTEFEEDLFKIQVPERNATMTALLNRKQNVPTPDISCELLEANYRLIYETINSEIPMEQLPHFFEWLSRRVLLVSITAYDDSEAYTIFESMNDRGKPLTNLDMLKGQLLSGVPDEKIEEASKMWVQIEKNFNSAEEFHTFVIALFRAKWAKSTAQTPAKRQSPHGSKDDWSDIQKHYHKFLKNNRSRIGMESFEIIKEMKYYSDLHVKLTQYKNDDTADFKELQRLHHFGLIYLDIPFYGLIQVNDKDESLKIKIISRFLNIRLGFASWNNTDSSNEGNAASRTVSLINRLRATDRYENPNVLTWFLYQEIGANMKRTWGNFDDVEAPKLRSKKSLKSQMFFMLASFSEFFENQDRNIFSEFYRSKDKYEIEHMLASNYEHNSQWYSSEEELEVVRDDIGALGLLQKSVNASLNNLSYSKKLSKYRDQNAYLASLSSSFYRHDGKVANKPRLNKTLDDNEALGRKLRAFEDMNRTSVKSRNDLCREIAKVLWNREHLNEFINTEVFHTMDDIGEFVKNGYIEDPEGSTTDTSTHTPGDKLVYSHDGAVVEAVFDGGWKVAILRIVNAPKRKIGSKATNDQHKKFVADYDKVFPQSTPGSSASTYSWSGKLPGMYLSSMINLAHGMSMAGRVNNDEVVNITKT